MGVSTFAGILILPTKSQSAKVKMGRVMKLLKLAARAYPSAVRLIGFGTQGCSAVREAAFLTVG